MSTYPKILAENKTPFHCPHCYHLLLAKDFEEHCAAVHQLDTAQQCAWCFGHEKRSDLHLPKCYASFCQSLDTCPSNQPQPDTPTLMNLKCCVVKDDAIHDNLPQTPVWEVKPELSGISYQCDRLNLAVACFQWFLRARAEMDWYHITIGASYFLRFLKAMDAEGGKTRTLPFSCLCKKAGGRGTSHRHFILVTSSKGHFLRYFWKKMGTSQKQKVESPIDLLHVIGWLSQGNPPCGGRTYCTLKPLPPLHTIVLAVQWDNGLTEILREMYALTDPYLLIPGAQSFNGLWVVQVRDLPGIAKQIVLPVSDHFHPTLETTEYFVHLTRGRKLFFERKETVAGVDVQAEKGNLFYDVIGDDVYYPTPYQQKFIRTLQPIGERIVELECSVEGKEQHIDQLEENLEKVKKRNGLLKRQCKVSDDTVKRLQRKHIRQLERENDILRLESRESKKQRFFYRASL